MKKRIVSLFICIIMLMTFLPSGVFAQGELFEITTTATSCKSGNGSLSSPYELQVGDEFDLVIGVNALTSETSFNALNFNIRYSTNLAELDESKSDYGIFTKKVLSSLFATNDLCFSYYGDSQLCAGNMVKLHFKALTKTDTVQLFQINAYAIAGNTAVYAKGDVAGHSLEDAAYLSPTMDDYVSLRFNITEKSSEASSQKTPPVLTADTTENYVGKDIEITFSDDADWRNSINNVCIGSTNIFGYKKEAGKLLIPATAYYKTQSGNRNMWDEKNEAGFQIVVYANGYEVARVTQPILEEYGSMTPAELSADKTNRTTGADITLTFPANADNTKWSKAVSSVEVNGSSVTGYTVSETGEITLPGSVFPTAGTYSIVVKAAGYKDTDTVSQLIVAAAPDVTTITTTQQMAEFAASVDAGNDYTGKKVKLGADIDLTALSSWNPVGSLKDDCAFAGTFDGCGHTVTLKDFGTGFSGIFDFLWGATVKDIETDGAAIGTAVVNAAYGSRIENCTNYADVSANTATGTNSGKYAAGIARICTISDDYQGLSFAESGLYDCLNYGEIKGVDASGVPTYSAAGICPNASRIERCGNYGDVTGGNSFTVRGAALGVADEIADSFNTGNLVTYYNQASAMTGNKSVTNCYNTGNVTQTGGGDKSVTVEISGIRSGDVMQNCYNKGTVSATISWDYDIYELNSDVPENCYEKADTVTASLLSTVKFKKDENNINGGNPLLWWQEDSASDEAHTLTISATPADATISLYSDEAHTRSITVSSEGKYSLKPGTYYYSVAKDGYFTVNGSANMMKKDKTVTVSLVSARTVTFSVTPAEAEFTVEDASGTAVSYSTKSGGSYTYSLADGVYTYSAVYTGYNSTTREINVTADTTVKVELTKSDYNPSAAEDKYIYGTGNEGKTNTITKGGTYYLGDGATGILTVATSEPVTLVGKGIANSEAYKELFLECSGQTTDLTLQDLYISDTESTAYTTNVIDYSGTGNQLKIAGTCILDYDGNAAGWAMIHVANGTELTVSSVDGGTLYLYKREQGAGFGGNGGAHGTEGQEPETNGEINIIGLNMFAKNSKQGALIGAGAVAGTQVPGKVTITDSNLYLLAISRGGAIGGSAGSNGASSGTEVTVTNSTLTINLDFSGSAIGGGGYDAGNDSDGGTLIYNSGSIRTFIDYNAVDPNGDGDTSDSLWRTYGATKQGVNNNAGITADITDSRGTPLYLCIFNTKNISGSSFTVTSGGSTVYSGSLHQYAYINEALHKDSQIPISYTLDNWVDLDDTNLYLYLPATATEMTVNGTSYTLDYNASPSDNTSGYFTIKDPSGNVVVPDDTTNGQKATEEEIKTTTTTSTDGTAATVVVDETSLTEHAEDATSATTLVISGDYTKDTTSVTTSITAKGMDAAAASGADVRIETPAGNVTISAAGLKDLADSSNAITVTVTENGDGSTSVIVKDGDTVLDTVAGGIKLKQSYSGDGNVAVLVKADGTKEIIQKSLVENNTAYTLLNGTAKIEIEDNSKTFDDVADSAWYSQYVDFVSSHEIMVGTSENAFAPDMSVSRGMTATILWNLEGKLANNGETKFPDVNASQWFAQATEWASEKGIISGYDTGSFGPNDAVTREQLAVVLYNYMKALGYDVSAKGDLSKFSDGSSTSTWASDAMQWAVGAGLFSGDENGQLMPQADTTRASMSVIVDRLITMMVK